MATTIRQASFGDKSGIHEAHMGSIRGIWVLNHRPEEIKGYRYRKPKEHWNLELQKNNLKHQDKIESARIH